MNIIVNIFRIYPDKSPAGLFEKLREAYPAGVGAHLFECRLPQGDPRIESITKILNDHGMQPWTYADGHPQDYHYRIEYLREYDEADLKEVGYFAGAPGSNVGLTVHKSEAGILQLQLAKVHKLRGVAGANWPWVVVPKEVRQRMVKARLAHAVFREVEIYNRKKRVTETDPGVREMTSDLVLPPMSPSCTFRHSTGEPFTGDYSKGCNIHEGYYKPPEFHYRAKDLETIGEFDVALTHERFGATDSNAHRKLVFSKQFYDFCVVNKLKMNWIPVRLDPQSVQESQF